MELKRGDIVTIVMQGDYGKPRPAIVVQSSALLDADSSSVIVCPLTTHLGNVRRVRVDIKPSAQNGLEYHSQVMIEKIAALPEHKIGKIIGKAEKSVMQEINLALTFILGLTD